jgi:hypothetical protein
MVQFGIILPLRIWFSLGLFFPYVGACEPTRTQGINQSEKQPFNFNSTRADFNLELHPDFILE